MGIIETLKKRIVNWTLNRKILVIYVLINIGLFFLAAMIGINLVVRNSEDLLSRSMGNTLAISAENMSGLLDSIESLSYRMLGDQTIQEQLGIVYESNESSLRSAAFEKLYAAVQSYNLQSSSLPIKYISLYNNSYTTNSDSGRASRTPQLVNELLISSALADDGAFSFNTNYLEDYGLFGIRSIRQTKNFSMIPLGVLTICVDFDRAVKQTINFSNAYDTTYYILSSNGKMIYHSPELPAENAEKISADFTEEYKTVDLENGKFFAVRGQLRKYGWDYLCLVSYDETYQEIRKAYWGFLGMLLVALILAFFLSSGMIRSISRHFDRLIEKMCRFRGQTDTLKAEVYDYSERTDEIGILHQQFDSMSAEISSLIQDNYLREILTKDAQLKALETRVNPHFLYNVLESINWRAKSAGVTDISEMVEALGRLLRVSLDEEKSLICLREELELINCYMTIQKYRFEEQLDYSENLDEDMLDVLIPKLVLQPLVENAVRYAAETIIDGCCRISIDGRFDGDDLLLFVRNSDSSFEENSIEKLRSGELVPHGFGIGLLSIDDRLRLTFGEDYGIITYNEGGLAVCQVRIPREMNKRDQAC